MSDSVALQCECGAVSGRLQLKPAGRRLVCMCHSCQAYAKYLNKQSRILDEHGGTDIFQVTPAQIDISQGAEHLQCVCLSSGGPLRWYTDCCNTPVANTIPNPKVPFAGMPTVFMDIEDDQTRDQVLGSVRYRIHARHAVGDAEGHPSGPVGMLVATAISLLWNMLRGRSRPTPFFTEAGEPVAAPERLSDDARAAIGLARPE